MEQEGDDVEVGEGAPSTDRLSCDVLDCFASIESHGFVFGGIQTVDEHCDSDGRYLPDGVCMLIVKLCGGVKEELTE